MAFDAAKVAELRQRGYTDNEISWLGAQPDAETTWKSLGVIESRAQLRNSGFGEDEIFQLETSGYQFGSSQWWQKAQYLQQIRTVDWGAVAAKGYTPDQITWLKNVPSIEGAWQALAKFGTPGAAGGPGAPGGGIDFPGVPGLPSGSSDASAKAIIQGFLENYGLGGLAEWAWSQYANGAPIEQIMLDLRKRPEYKARFPAMEALAKKGMAISESQYVDYERQATGVMRAAGLPEGFYDQHGDFTKFLTSEVSISELNDRVQLAAQAAFTAPAEVRSELNRLYGIGAGDLTAYWIDPDKALPLLQQKFVAAQIGGASQRTGFGNLAVSEAERLASLGIDNPTQGFDTLVSNKELFTPLPGEPGEAIGRGDQLAAAFEGNVDAQNKIEKRARTRLAPFASGGGFALSKEGFGGVGSQSKG